MRKHRLTSLMAGIIAAPLTTGLSAAEPSSAKHDIEEVVVTGPFHETVTESAIPISLLSGEALRKQVANSLGDTLDGQLGVHSSSFGPGVGQPVLRGQSGKRVQVLQNSVFVADAASLSPDHANGVEPLLADSIEVVRGPATLLYGSGAIGGVVNVLDNRIPNRLYEQPEIVFEQSHSSVSDQNKSVFGLSSSVGSMSFHIDAFDRRNENVDIKGVAADEESIEALEALQGIVHDEEEEEEGAPADGYIENSSGEAKGVTLGLSWVQENGFVGFSYNKIESEYGLPPGTHGHEDEHGHDDDDDHHDDDDHDEDEHDEEHGDEHGEEEEVIRLALEQERYDFKGDYHFKSGLFEEANFHIGYTDYEHVELEIEEGIAAVGTRFLNDGFDSRFSLTTRERGGWQGVWGMQANATDFSAVGEEAFIPATDIQNTALFIVERLVQDQQTFEFGARVERAELDSGSCDQSDTVFSVSASMIRDVANNGTLTVGIGRSERAPTVEERFSNVDTGTCGVTTELVTHAATNLIEVGNVNLDTETSRNVDVGYRLNMGEAYMEVSAFYNDIDDYVFLNITGQQVDETLVANYLGQDAKFYGLEALLDFPVFEADGYALNGSVSADFVRGEFSNGDNVPRLPPARVAMGFNWTSADWTAEIEMTRVFQQDDTARLELPTKGYTLVSLYGDYHWNFDNDVELTLFARADNLLNNEVRSHVSFLKNVAPEAGRNIQVGLRVNY